MQWMTFLKTDIPREKVNFQNFTVKNNNELDIKPTDTQQYLHASSFNVYHSGK